MATTSLRRAWLAYGAAGLVLLAVGLPQAGPSHAMFYNLTGLAVFAAGDLVYSFYAYVLLLVVLARLVASPGPAPPPTGCWPPR